MVCPKIKDCEREVTANEFYNKCFDKEAWIKCDELKDKKMKPREWYRAIVGDDPI